MDQQILDVATQAHELQIADLQATIGKQRLRIDDLERQVERATGSSEDEISELRAIVDAQESAIADQREIIESQSNLINDLSAHLHCGTSRASEPSSQPRTPNMSQHSSPRPPAERAPSHCSYRDSTQLYGGSNRRSGGLPLVEQATRGRRDPSEQRGGTRGPAAGPRSGAGNARNRGQSGSRSAAPSSARTRDQLLAQKRMATGCLNPGNQDSQEWARRPPYIPEPTHATAAAAKLCLQSQLQKQPWRNDTIV
uniref:Uncharacterized protein n=1 Tax=Noctiluca scintillans TaxID=2966 RepID=A0A7S1FIG8_NOCSC